MKIIAILLGALIAAWLVANHSIDLDMKEIAFRTFLINIDHKSMEKQLHILELLKIIPEASENEDSDFEEGSKSPGKNKINCKARLSNLCRTKRKETNCAR